MRLLDATAKVELTDEGAEAIEQFREEYEGASYCLENSGGSNESGKWYSHEQDLKEFSKKYPDILFMLEGEGEENDDMWHLYVRNGKSQKQKAVITFPPFDPSRF